MADNNDAPQPSGALGATGAAKDGPTDRPGGEGSESAQPEIAGTGTAPVSPPEPPSCKTVDWRGTTEPPGAAPGAGSRADYQDQPESAAPEAEETRLRAPFPFARLFFAVLFGVLASLVFWIVILLSALQFITIAISGEKNDELDRFNRRIARYMQEMFDYTMLSSDMRPFPFGPFPAE